MKNKIEFQGYQIKVSDKYMAEWILKEYMPLSLNHFCYILDIYCVSYWDLKEL